MKRLSIIVPLYNSEKYLPKCLDSLLAQDIPHEDYEIILVNDGSPDHSKDLADKYADQYPNISVLSQENKGTSGARNTGLRHASGEYVYFVDPDDYVLENSLKVILQKMDDESLDVLRFGYVEVDENYRPTKSCKHPEQPDYSSKVMDGYTFMGERLGIACYVWTFLFRTSLIKDNHLYFPEGVYYDDTPWLPLVIRQAKRVDSTDWRRHFYLIRANSLVQSSDRKSLMKKVDGQKYLIQELIRQLATTDNQDAIHWYRKMIGHCMVTMLTLAGLTGDKKEISNCANIAKDYRRLLSPFGGSRLSSRIKSILLYLSPKLFCRVVYIKSLEL